MHFTNKPTVQLLTPRSPNGPLKRQQLINHCATFSVKTDDSCLFLKFVFPFKNQEYLKTYPLCSPLCDLAERFPPVTD